MKLALVKLAAGLLVAGGATVVATTGTSEPKEVRPVEPRQVFPPTPGFNTTTGIGFIPNGQTGPVYLSTIVVVRSGGALVEYEVMRPVASPDGQTFTGWAGGETIVRPVPPGITAFVEVHYMLYARYGTQPVGIWRQDYRMTP